LGRLSRRPLIASNISPAAVFRVDKLDPQAGDLIRFLALSGLRKGEALGLRFADVDLERGVMRFEDHKTSEQAGTKVLPLNTHLKTILQRRLSQKLGVEAKQVVHP
jgi:integrase